MRAASSLPFSTKEALYIHRCRGLLKIDTDIKFRIWEKFRRFFLSGMITLSTGYGGCSRRKPPRPHPPRRAQSKPQVFHRDAAPYADCPA